ncbi:MAG TPA: hypothetical protein VGN37_27945 [Actinocatenispora sp.]
MRSPTALPLRLAADRWVAAVASWCGGRARRWAPVIRPGPVSDRV